MELLQEEDSLVSIFFYQHMCSYFRFFLRKKYLRCLVLNAHLSLLLLLLPLLFNFILVECFYCSVEYIH